MNQHLKTPVQQLENWLYYIGITYSDARDLRQALFQVITRLKEQEQVHFKMMYEAGSVHMKQGIVDGIQPDAEEYFNKIYEKEIRYNHD